MTEYEIKMIEEMDRLNNTLEGIEGALGNISSSAGQIFATLEDLLHEKCFPGTAKAIWERNRRRMPTTE